MARDSTEFAQQSGERAMQAVAFGMTWAREFAEDGFSQGKQALDGFLRVSRKMAEDFENQACAMRENATALTEKTLSNTMEFGQKLARAKEPQEFAQCQSEFLARQAQAVADQTKVFGERMQKAVDVYQDQLQGLRTGRATPGLVDSLRVDYYGSPTPLKQIANISVPEPQQIVIRPFDASALTNIAKHAGATEIEIDVHADGRRVTAIVRDNGRGFDVARAVASRERGLGLFGMHERAQLIGGYVDVRSTPGQGSIVTLVAPLHSAEEQPQ